MSRFNDRNVSKLARKAYQYPIDGFKEDRRRAREAAPLLGKEARLLVILQEAEQTYDEWLELSALRKKTQQLMAAFPHDCKTLTKSLQIVIDCWRQMDRYEGKYELACRIMSTREEVDAFVREADSAMETLQNVLRGAASGATDPYFTYRGTPVGTSNSGAPLEALKEFTKVVRRFWIDEISNAFNYADKTLDQFDGRRFATSAAARLIERAAKILDERFTIGSVRDAMETARRDPQPF
jgi:hypothetical protein